MKATLYYIEDEAFFFDERKAVTLLHSSDKKHLQLRVQIRRNFSQLVPFTEETVYNSDRHVAIMLLFAYSAAHALKEGSHVFVLEFSGQSPCGSPDNHE